MTPEQALQILDNACAQIQLNRADHAKVQECVALLRTFIAKKSKRPKKKDT